MSAKLDELINNAKITELLNKKKRTNPVFS